MNIIIPSIHKEITTFQSSSVLLISAYPCFVLVGSRIQRLLSPCADKQIEKPESKGHIYSHTIS